MQSVGVKLRRLIAGSFVAIFSTVAAAQDAPIKFGLWEGTFQQRTTASPMTASILKKKGQPIPPSFTQPYRRCIDKALWLKSKAAVSTTPEGCAFLHRESTASSLITKVKCDAPDGTSILLDSDITWESPVKTHATNRLTTIYPGLTGKVVREQKFESHFVATDCGTIAPGKTVPLD